MLGRRGFLKTIGVAVLGMSLALKAPEVKQESVAERFIREYQEQNAVTRIDVLLGYPRTRGGPNVLGRKFLA